MITGEELAVHDAIAGHIYQQRWPGILLVSQRLSTHLEEWLQHLAGVITLAVRVLLLHAHCIGHESSKGSDGFRHVCSAVWG